MLAFNISPRGQIEGVLLQTKLGPTQVNFPKTDAEALAHSMHAGSTVDIKAELETDAGEHPVYMAVGKDDEASGTIVRTNYGLHGEANGYHLDEGTFIHIRPEAVKKYKLRVGERVTATGSRRPGSDAVVLEVRTIARAEKPQPAVQV